MARTADHRGRFIVFDGVYSMEGDLCELAGMVAVKEQFGARLLVDDAHGIGVLGQNGRGTAEHFGLEDSVDLVMGTFSKSLATAGGFIAGDKYVVDYIAHNARAQIFSAASPPPCAASALAALDIIEREPERRAALWRNVEYMQSELRALGFDTGESKSPVIPLVVGEDWTAFRMVARLQEEGVFANPVITPAVPPGRSMVRTSYMATHERVHLDRCLEALAKVGREFGVI
jgi:7-keto-8-aminopelargonate synthetase-like enzyme